MSRNNGYTAVTLFPDDRVIPADALDSVQVKLSGLELRRPRAYGSCWLACGLWHELGLDEFWQQRLGEGREAVSWEKVLQLLVVNRLLDPGSEFRVHRQWFDSSAMDELLQTDFAVAEKDRLYRCLDRLLEHKQDLFVWLKQKWADLFGAEFEVLLYDLTSTYFEGDMEQNPKARRGYSRDGRSDCAQLVIALVVTPDGFPLAYEVMNGNTSERTTLRTFLKKSRARTVRRGGFGSWIAAFPAKPSWRRCANPSGKRFIWSARRRAESTSMRRNGWICFGKRSAIRWK